MALLCPRGANQMQSCVSIAKVNAETLPHVSNDGLVPCFTYLSMDRKQLNVLVNFGGGDI